MRLIDADALEKSLEKLWNVHDDQDFANKDVWREIENAPTADPERKKGKWQRRKDKDCWECSECHAVLESDDIVRHNFYYCYHCGTEMMNEDGYMKLEGTEHE